MIKGIFIAAVVLIAGYQLDRHFNHGYYGDGALAMLRQMRHSFR